MIAYPLIHPWTLGLFPPWAVVNHVAVNVGVQIAVTYRGVELSGHMAVLRVACWGRPYRRAQWLSHLPHSHRQCARLPMFTPAPTLVILFFSIMAILMDVRCFLDVLTLYLLTSSS